MRKMCYDAQAKPTPVQYYLTEMNLNNKDEPEEVEEAVRPILECLLGLYKKCLETLPVELDSKKDCDK